MVVQPGGIFAPAPDLREVLGKRGVNWVMGQIGNLRRLATAACAGKTTGAQFAKLPTIESRYRGWSVHDLHAALLYLRDADHQQVRGDVVRPVTAFYGRRRPCGRLRAASNGLRQ